MRKYFSRLCYIQPLTALYIPGPQTGPSVLQLQRDICNQRLQKGKNMHTGACPYSHFVSLLFSCCLDPARPSHAACTGRPWPCLVPAMPWNLDGLALGQCAAHSHMISDGCYFGSPIEEGRDWSLLTRIGTRLPTNSTNSDLAAMDTAVGTPHETRGCLYRRILGCQPGCSTLTTCPVYHGAYNGAAEVED